MLVIWKARPLMNGVLLGMTLANGYLYPIAVAGVTTVKLTAMTLRCTSHALWHFGVHYLLASKKSAEPDEGEPRHGIGGIDLSYQSTYICSMRDTSGRMKASKHHQNCQDCQGR